MFSLAGYAAPLPPPRADLYPHLRLDTGGAGINKVLVFEPRRGENSIAVGKGTLFVPAAHGGRSLDLPTLKGSHRCGLSGGEVLLPPHYNPPSFHSDASDAIRDTAPEPQTSVMNIGTREGETGSAPSFRRPPDFA